MRNILLFIILNSVSYANADYKILLNSSQKLDIPEKKEIIQETIGPEFWTATGVNLKGLYPNYSDSSSLGAGEGNFNFGQKAFLGDPKGLAPYDKNYDSSLWKNGTFHTGNFIRPNSNLSSARYIKSYNTGQYYFEITVGGDPASDSMGMAYDTNTPLYNQSNVVGIGRIGTYFTNKIKYYNSTSSLWANDLEIISGDTIQVYLDYDNNRFLMKKLGTDINSYYSPIVVD